MIDIAFLENQPILRSFCFYCSILVLKMLFMSFYTGTKRMITGIFVNPEDTVMHNMFVKKTEVCTDEKIERIRRAHLNDLENIPIFMIIGFVYTLTNPHKRFAMLLFRSFTAARFVHTFVYAIFPLPQPSRMLSFFAGALITSYMALASLIHFTSEDVI